MSKRNWGYVAAFGGIVALLAFIVFGLIQQGIYAQDSQARASDYAERAANQIEQSCVGVAPAKKAACLRKAVTEYRLQTRNNQREYDDLVAQRTSALWTMITGIAALIGMALSVVGVWLVRLTFLEQKTGNENARKAALDAAADTARALAHAKRSADAAAAQVKVSEETAKRQLRPYLGTPGAAIFDPIMSPRIVIDIKNFGQTPARIIAQDFRIIHFAKENIAANPKRIFYTIPVQANAFCDPGHAQSRSGIIDGPINFGADDHIFAELTLTYVAFDNAVFWRRMSYRADRRSTWVENNKVVMDVHEIDAEAGDGHPPASNLPKD